MSGSHLGPYACRPQPHGPVFARTVCPCGTPLSASTKEHLGDALLEHRRYHDDLVLRGEEAASQTESRM